MAGRGLVAFEGRALQARAGEGAVRDPYNQHTGQRRRIAGPRLIALGTAYARHACRP